MSQRRPEVRPYVILLVEDNEDARSIYAAYMRNAGHEVIEAATLDAASAAFDERRPDLVVLDRNLPDGDGLDLARRWRSIASEPPIIMVTASGQDSDMHAALGAGCDVFLTKPCTGDVLLLQIDRALGLANVNRRSGSVSRRSDPPAAE
jgi:DNA-binding response OmpR family regulator